MFRAHVLIIRRSKLHYTASGIITPIGGRLVHTRVSAHIESSSSPQDVDPDIQTFTALGIPQCSKGLYVWIYILRAWKWLDVSRNTQPISLLIYFKNFIKYCCVWLLWSFPLFLYFKHFGMVNVRFRNIYCMNMEAESSSEKLIAIS